MTKQEFKPILAMLQSAYPSDKYLSSDEEYELWLSMLSDLDAGILKSTVRRYIRDKAFPPRIADIRAEYESQVENEKSYKQQLKEIYLFTKGVYPSAEDTVESRVAWSVLVNRGKSWTEKLSIAAKVRSKTMHYVEDAERDGRVNEMPTFLEYLKGLKV